MSCPSARFARAHPHCPVSPPAGRSSLRMSRRCCVASSMSMLAQEAMGPVAGALSGPRSFRCRRAPSSLAQARQGETAGRRSLYSPSTHSPQTANRTASLRPSNPTNRFHFRPARSSAPGTCADWRIKVPGWEAGGWGGRLVRPRARLSTALTLCQRGP